MRGNDNMDNNYKGIAIVERKVAEEYINGGQEIEYPSSVTIDFRKENKHE